MVRDVGRHQRRSIRLSSYDYAEPGAYFVTICSQDHLGLFGSVVGEEMQPNEPGRMVLAAWSELPVRYPGVVTDAFVLMPNHIHGIVVLAASVGATPCGCPGPYAQTAPYRQTEAGQARGPAPTSTNDDRCPLSLGDIVSRFKTLTTKRYIHGVRSSRWSPFPGRLWQRNYYEHIIRNEYALSHIRQYILANPARWAWDRENPAAITPEEPDAWRL